MAESRWEAAAKDNPHGSNRTARSISRARMSACVLVSWAPEATEKSTRIPTPTNRLNSARGSDHIILCPIGLAPRHHESPEVFANSGESGPTRPVNQFQVGLSAGEILGTARGDQQGAPPTRSMPTHGGSRPTCARLLLVHRGLRHARPKRGENAPRRTGFQVAGERTSTIL